MTMIMILIIITVVKNDFTAVFGRDERRSRVDNNVYR